MEDIIPNISPQKFITEYINASFDNTFTLLIQYCNPVSHSVTLFKNQNFVINSPRCFQVPLKFFKKALRWFCYKMLENTSRENKTLKGMKDHFKRKYFSEFNLCCLPSVLPMSLLKFVFLTNIRILFTTIA